MPNTVNDKVTESGALQQPETLSKKAVRSGI